MAGSDRDDPRRDDGDLDPEQSHFSDEELEEALAGFEREFTQDDGADGADSPDGKPDDAPGDGQEDLGSLQVPDDASELDPSVGFEAELEGLLGDKAKVAVIVTRLASAELLAAFCQLADISASCVGSNEGAVAVLRNLDGDGPEAAARDLTTVVGGMSVILAVNRADKLEVTLYMQGKSGPSVAPPILFTSTPRFVEDLTLGITTLAQLRTQGFETVETSDLDHDGAMAIIARHTRFGKGGSTRGSRVA